MDRELENILRLLTTNDYRFYFDCGLTTAGKIDKDKIIHINPLIGDRVVTLIHVCLHETHSEWTAGEVDDTTERVFRKLSHGEEEILLYYLKEFRK